MKHRNDGGLDNRRNERLKRLKDRGFTLPWDTDDKVKEPADDEKKSGS